MEKTVAAYDARRNFGKMLQEVLARGDRFVIQRHGEPVAAVVPIEVYEQWKAARAAFFARLRSAAERSNLPPEEAAELTEEAVRTVRSRPDGR